MYCIILFAVLLIFNKVIEGTIDALCLLEQLEILVDGCTRLREYFTFLPTSESK